MPCSLCKWNDKWVMSRESADAALLTSSHLILHLFSLPSFSPWLDFLKFLHAFPSLFFHSASSLSPFLFLWPFAPHLSYSSTSCSPPFILSFFWFFFYSRVRHVAVCSHSPVDTLKHSYGPAHETNPIMPFKKRTQRLFLVWFTSCAERL